MSVTLRQLPRTITTTKISSTDTNPITLGTATAGQTVKLWGLLLVGGTSIEVKSSNTSLSGVLTTTGLALPLPRGNAAEDSAYPHFESASGEALSITPGASGLNGVAYWTQD